MEGLFQFPTIKRRAGRRRSRRRLFGTSKRRERSASLPSLPNIPDCLLFQPGDKAYDRYLPVYNLRTASRPALRAVCRSTKAVAGIVAWIRRHDLPFAVRSGGHSYEGYCNSTSVVIDLRHLDQIALDSHSKVVTIGAGAALGSIYTYLRDKGVAFVGGSCPTVAAGGHVLGGGYGLLARAHGLACDSLRSLVMIDAQARTVVASPSQNADLFWASRGAGGGALGIATEFNIQTHALAHVVTFVAVWSLPKARAAKVIDAWQRWAPGAPDAITCLLKVGKASGNKIMLRCVGQSTGAMAELRRELENLTAVEPVSQPLNLRERSFFEAVDYFAGSWSYESLFTKEKSDYALRLSQNGLDTMLDGLLQRPVGRLIVILNAYGGAINRLADDETAFPHRRTVGFLLHYYSQWASSSSTASRLRDMSAFHSAMRPHVSGGAYVNYCDSDLVNWERAYWADNLPRLKAVKRTYDPKNFFHHGQSVRPY